VNWNLIFENLAIVAVSVLFGMLLMAAIRRHFNKHEPFIPEIPHVRVGSPVMIGDDLYILKSYVYKEKSSTADSERTVIFKSVPTHDRVEQDV
jgi:uncharacterized membrane-anchored protein